MSSTLLALDEFIAGRLDSRHLMAGAKMSTLQA